MKDGSLSPAEKAQLNAAQNKTSRDITAAKNNGINGNPLSASSQRAQADTQRNINQQTRIANGVKRAAALTNHEAARAWSAASRMSTSAKPAPAPTAMSAPASSAASCAPTTARSARIYNKRHNAQVKG